MTETEQPLYGGLENARVFRIGDTVRRPGGDWSATNHALLAHLQTKRFPAPRPIGLDAEGREIVSFLPGEASLRPWPPVLLELDGVRQVGAMLRAYHAAVADFVPPSPAIWRQGPQDLAAGETVLHGDFGPYNLIWTGDDLTGVIDFELARPGRPIEDAVFRVIRVAHLRPDELAPAAGFVGIPDRRGRLQAFAGAYGCAPEALLDEVCAVQAWELGQMIRLGGAGREPWAGFLRRGLVAEAVAELRWLEANIGALR